MDHAAHLSHLRADGEALAAAAGGADPSTRVPSCPAWTIQDLVAHTGRVYRWVDRIVRTQAQEYVAGSGPDSADPAEVLAWYREGLERVVEALTEAEPALLVWNWRDRAPAPVEFWSRRMAQETTIHRWDAENAATPGGAAPIDAGLAVDGIDEYLSFVTRWLAAAPVPGLVGSLHLHATDVDGEWSLDLQSDGLALAREHRKSDAALRGPASDLFLWMVNRVPTNAACFAAFGDEALLARWSELKFR